MAKITDTAKTRGRVEIMEIYGSDGNGENYVRYATYGYPGNYGGG